MHRQRLSRTGKCNQAFAYHYTLVAPFPSRPVCTSFKESKAVRQASRATGVAVMPGRPKTFVMHVFCRNKEDTASSSSFWWQQGQDVGQTAPGQLTWQPAAASPAPVSNAPRVFSSKKSFLKRLNTGPSASNYIAPATTVATSASTAPVAAAHNTATDTGNRVASVACQTDWELSTDAGAMPA